MWPQIVSSLAAGAALNIAAVMLGSPVAVLGISLVCMFAFVSHGYQQAGSETGHIWATVVGLLVGALVWLYLLYLASQGAF